MLTIGLALGAACGWGLADFLAGQASRATSPLLVLSLTQALGLVLVLPIAGAAGSGPPPLRFVLFAMVSGAALTIGLGALYRGMVVGLVGIVSPIAATGTVISVVVGILQGDRPSAVQGMGVALSICGIMLVSWTRESSPAVAGLHDKKLSASVSWGLLAAVGGGITQIAIQQSARGGVLWVLIVQRSTVAMLAAVATRKLRALAHPPLALVPTLLVIGAADVSATGLYAASTRHGQLALAAVVSSLYPVLTVGLALTILRERLTGFQLGGVVAALIGTAAIAAGAA